MSALSASIQIECRQIPTFNRKEVFLNLKIAALVKRLSEQSSLRYATLNGEVHANPFKAILGALGELLHSSGKRCFVVFYD